MKKIQLPLKVDPAIKEALQAASNEHSNGKLSAYTESVLWEHVSKKDFKHIPKNEIYQKPKPIFCIGVPDSDGSIQAKTNIEKVREEYFVFVYHNPTGWKFDLFNGDNASEIKLDDFKNKFNG